VRASESLAWMTTRRLDKNLFKPYFDEPQQEEDDEVLYFTT
jgi:hypothetical protein